MSSRRGFSLIEIIVISGVVVLLAGVGYVGWKSFSKPSETATTEASNPSKQSAEVITTKADLEAAEKTLEELNFEDESLLEAEDQASL